MDATTLFSDRQLFRSQLLYEVSLSRTVREFQLHRVSFVIVFHLHCLSSWSCSVFIVYRLHRVPSSSCSFCIVFSMLAPILCKIRGFVHSGSYNDANRILLIPHHFSPNGVFAKYITYVICRKIAICSVQLNISIFEGFSQTCKYSYRND